MRNIIPFILFSFFMAFGQGMVNTAAAAAAQPAMIGQGADSVAAQLHYPAKERSSGAQAAVTFHCEVTETGEVRHLGTVCGKANDRFCSVVATALRRGRFSPAMLDGKPVAVMIGGTVLFMMANNRPTIAISLATADTGKVAAMANYMQPQMISTDALFRRKLWAVRDRFVFRPGVHPGAVVLAHVDSQGHLTGKTLSTESPPNGGFGGAVMAAVDGERFIAAQSNGKPVAGDFELWVNFEHMRNPDAAARVGTLIKKDDD